MKNIRTFVIGAGFAALLSASVLSAQITLETGEIPFDFTIGATSLPAGNYSVSTVNPAVILMRNVDTGDSAIVMPAARGNDKGKAVLAFHCYGDRCFLAEVDVPGSPAYVMKKSKLETEALKTDTKATMAFVTMERR